MKQTPPNGTTEQHVREIRRKTRKEYSSEEKIRIVISGLHGAMDWSPCLGAPTSLDQRHGNPPEHAGCGGAQAVAGRQLAKSERHDRGAAIRGVGRAENRRSGSTNADRKSAPGGRRNRKITVSPHCDADRPRIRQ